MTDTVIETVENIDIVETPASVVIETLEQVDVVETPSSFIVEQVETVEVVEVSTPGPQGIQGIQGEMGLNIEAHPFGKTLTGVYTGTFRLGFNGPYSFESIEAWSDVNVTGVPLVLDIIKNNTASLWTGAPGNRPTIAVGASRAVMAGAPSLSTFVDGDFVTFSVVQFGFNPNLDLQGNLRVRSTG